MKKSIRALILLVCCYNSSSKSSNDLSITGICPDVQRIIAGYLEDSWLSKSQEVQAGDPMNMIPKDGGVYASPYINDINGRMLSQSQLLKMNHVCVKSSASLKISASINHSNQVIIRDLSSAKIIDTVYFAEHCADIDFSPCGKFLAIAHGENLTILDITSKSRLTKKMGSLVTALAYKPNSSDIAVALTKPTQRTRVEIWNLNSGRQKAVLFNQAAVHSVFQKIAFSCDGSYIGCCDHTRCFVLGTETGFPEQFSTDTNQEPAVEMQFSPKNKYEFVCVYGGVLRVFALRPSKVGLRRGCDTSLLANDFATDLLSVSYAPDGNAIVAGDSAGKVNVFQRERDSKDHYLHGCGNWKSCKINDCISGSPILSVNFHNNGTILATSLDSRLLTFKRTDYALLEDQQKISNKSLVQQVDVKYAAHNFLKDIKDIEKHFFTCNVAGLGVAFIDPDRPFIPAVMWSSAIGMAILALAGEKGYKKRSVKLMAGCAILNTAVAVALSKLLSTK